MKRADDPPITIRDLDLRDPVTAHRLHTIWRAAYTQEAHLLGVRDFPPLARTLADLAAGPERFLGAYRDTQLAGAAGIEPGDDPASLHIASLVVDPAHQRRGIARALVEHLIARHGAHPITVSTGAANHPALTLYRGLGFIESERRIVGREPVEIVILRRTGQ